MCAKDGLTPYPDIISYRELEPARENGYTPQMAG